LGSRGKKQSSEKKPEGSKRGGERNEHTGDAYIKNVRRERKKTRKPRGAAITGPGSLSGHGKGPLLVSGARPQEVRHEGDPLLCQDQDRGGGRKIRVATSQRVGDSTRQSNARLKVQGRADQKRSVATNHRK